MVSSFVLLQNSTLKPEVRVTALQSYRRVGCPASEASWKVGSEYSAPYEHTHIQKDLRDPELNIFSHRIRLAS